jgi:hypothetical protein
MLQIVASLSDDSRGSFYDHDIFLVQATSVFVHGKLLQAYLKICK